MTVRWRDPPVNRPEVALLGSEYTNSVAGRSPFIVENASSWFYRGTDLANGDAIPDLVYGESDRPRGSVASAVASPVLLLSNSPFQSRDGQPDRSEAVIYRAVSGAWVFDAGTFGWPAAVNPFGQPDQRIERVTTNILARMVSAL